MLKERKRYSFRLSMKKLFMSIDETLGMTPASATHPIFSRVCCSSHSYLISCLKYISTGLVLHSSPTCNCTCYIHTFHGEIHK